MFDSTKRNPNNDSLPFSYFEGGYNFSCKRCDFRDEVYVTGDFEGGMNPSELKRYSTALTCMISHHAGFIHPYLSSFSGYDTIRFVFVQSN